MSEDTQGRAADPDAAAQSNITRRDFLDGAAIPAPASRTGLPPGYYPLSATGPTSEADIVIRTTLRLDPPALKPQNVHSTKQCIWIAPLRPVRDVDNDYDSVLVGSGASGLGA